MVLLSYIVEESSGTHFINYCQWNIFNPLEMNSTSHYFPDLGLPTIPTSALSGEKPPPIPVGSGIPVPVHR